MKENTKKDIILLLNLIVVIGLVVIFFSQPILLKANENISLLAIGDNFLDYELMQMKNLIMAFDKEFMFGLLNIFALPFALLSLFFMFITKFKSGFKRLLILFTVLTFICAGVAFYAGFSLSQEGVIALTNFSYIYLVLNVSVSMLTIAFFKM